MSRVSDEVVELHQEAASSDRKAQIETNARLIAKELLEKATKMVGGRPSKNGYPAMVRRLYARADPEEEEPELTPRPSFAKERTSMAIEKQIPMTSGKKGEEVQAEPKMEKRDQAELTSPFATAVLEMRRGVASGRLPSMPSSSAHPDSFNAIQKATLAARAAHTDALNAWEEVKRLREDNVRLREQISILQGEKPLRNIRSSVVGSGLGGWCRPQRGKDEKGVREWKEPVHPSDQDFIEMKRSLRKSLPGLSRRTGRLPQEGCAGAHAAPPSLAMTGDSSRFGERGEKVYKWRKVNEEDYKQLEAEAKKNEKELREKQAALLRGERIKKKSRKERRRSDSMLEKFQAGSANGERKNSFLPPIKEQ